MAILAQAIHSVTSLEKNILPLARFPEYFPEWGRLGSVVYYLKSVTLNSGLVNDIDHVSAFLKHGHVHTW